MVLQLDPDDDEAEQRRRDSIERRMRRQIERSLDEQRNGILASGLERLDRESFARWARDDLEKIVRRTTRDIADYRESDELSEDELYDALRNALQESTDLGVSVAVEQFESIGFGFDWTLPNADAREWASRYAATLVRSIDDTTVRMVRDSVSEWIDNGQPLETLVQELTIPFGRRRAELIASTEVTKAYAEGNRRAYQETGITSQWEWRTAQDERVCPICGPLHGQQLSIGDGFDNVFDEEDRRALGIRAFDAPPAHPRCRCWVVPVINEVANG